MAQPYGVDCLRLWWNQAGCSTEGLKWQQEKALSFTWWNQQTVSTTKWDMGLYFEYALKAYFKNGIPFMVLCWGEKPLEHSTVFIIFLHKCVQIKQIC